jgi:hypothetical protein
MDPTIRAIAIFVGATAGAVALHQVATREAAKLGLPHMAAGALAAILDYKS